MKKIFIIGSSTLDLFFQDPSLTLRRDRFTLAVGGKYVVNTFYEGVGGGGANVAVGLSRQGFPCVLWSEIGRDSLTKLIRERLEKEGVDCSLLEHKEKNINISSILLSPSGERTIINHRSHEAQMMLTDDIREKVRQSSFLYVGNMPEMPLSERVELVKLVKLVGGKVAVNLGVKDCRLGIKKLSDLLSQVDYLIVNRYELSDIVGILPNELLLHERSYHTTLGLKSDALLVVTDGALGSYAHAKDTVYFQKIIPVEKVVDTTGAGDAFSTGFIAAQLSGNTIQESLLSGAISSASVIQKIGAQEGLIIHT